MTDTLRTDVLVIGSGPAGATAALALATLGVEHIVITKYSWTANTPSRPHHQSADGRGLPGPGHRG